MASGETHSQKTKDNYRSDVLHDVVVTKINQLSQTVKGYELKVTSKTGFKFLAGQWLDVHIPVKESTIGGYSITSSPNMFDKYGKFGLAIQYSDHPPTHWMHNNCNVGTKLTVRVGGDFWYNPTPPLISDLLLVAGGIGINPIYSILRHQALLVEATSTRNPHSILLYTACNSQELIFKDDITKQKTLETHYFTTRETPIQAHINGRRIDSADVVCALKKLNAKYLQCYICGPPSLISFITGVLTTEGIDEECIHFEKWW